MLTSKSVIAPYALLPGGWSANVRIEIDADGSIGSITSDSAHADATLLSGPVITGLPNVHSHAFQRAFAGQAERRINGDDSFWTWRTAMYEFANRITPDDLEAIATQVYVEMLEAGYTAVGEFHYVHHDAGGTPFGVRSEMSQRLLAAAAATGIGMTLLPVFYRWSNFANAPPLREQARFITNLDSFMTIVQELAPLCREPQRALGIAPHSLRAVAPADLRDVVAAFDERSSQAPIHLHIAEQSAEVEASMASYGTRPVQWLCEHFDLSRRWCLIHATHLNAAEVAAAATSGAVAGICPTTEANLGDGIFPLAAWIESRGAVALGSDSHASVDAAQEVRWLEYTQRLQRRRRTVTASPQALYAESARGGGHALGRPIGTIAAGQRADFIVLDAQSSALYGDIETIVDRYVIRGGAHVIRDVYVGGEQVVSGGRHRLRDVSSRRFIATLQRLGGPLGSRKDTG